MVKLMIVDDEQIVRDGVKFIIDHNFAAEVKITGLARTGREAIEMFEEDHPQIVLMDIQMPGINGLEAIKRIQFMDSKVRFVIISAYEQFEYAKSAVQLGVLDYILKPINKNKLTETVSKIIGEIKEERQLKQKEIETQEKLDKILPVLEYGYIYSIIMNTDYQKESSDYHNLLDIQRAYGYMMVIELGEGANYTEVSNKIGTGVRGNAQYKAIRNAIKFKCRAVVGPLIVNRISVMVYEDMPEDEYQQRIKAVTLGESICKRIREIADTEVFIGIGSCHPLDQMNISFNEAVKTISRMTDENVLHIMDAVSGVDRKGLLMKLKSDEEAIVKRVEEGNSALASEQLKLFFTRLQKLYVEDREMGLCLAIELMVMVYNAAYRNDSSDHYRLSAEYVDEIRQFEDFFEVRNYCTSKTVAISDSIHQEKENRVSNVISEAMDFIEINSAKDIRLKDVAEAVAISPQYFSKIFKKELGVNFIDHLTQVRMNRAKIMLRQGELSIKEICYEIGYNDPNYFSRLFKKVEGVSPTDY